MEGNWRDLFAQVEGALARVGIVAGSYDDCDLWQVAAMLGANEPDEQIPRAPDEQGYDPLAFVAEGFVWPEE